MVLIDVCKEELMFSDVVVVQMECLVQDLGCMYYECNEVLCEVVWVYYEVLLCLLLVVDFKDDDIGVYIMCIGYFVEVMVELLGELLVFFCMLCWVVLMYDIGKIGILDGVFKKFGVYIVEEWVVMNEYLCMGVEILGCFCVLLFCLVVEVVLGYYECWDGGGYFVGLVGEDILLLVCIVVVVDYLDVLMMDCCYCKVFLDDMVLCMFVEQCGWVFDLCLVDLFLVYVIELLVLCDCINEKFLIFEELLEDDGVIGEWRKL